jgi:Prenyltransferase and squalene oxidase repeat
MHRRIVTFVGLAATLALGAATPLGAVDPAVSQRAVGYLASQQGPNGAWDSSPGTEFVTSDATLAVAEQAQTTTSWSAAEARAGLDALPEGSPLGFLDEVAQDALTPGKAAKLIVLVAGPTAIDPFAFDPAGDGDPVDLVAAVGAPNPDGSFGAPGLFNGTLFAALATRLVEGAVPPQTVAYIRSTQRPDGGWSFDGDPASGVDADVDTTGLAMQALVAGGVAPGDATLQGALGYLATTANPDGTWSLFDTVSAESTSRAILAIESAGYDVSSPCWRDNARPDLAGAPYVNPEDALAALQQPDGSIAGPAVASTTFATAQAVQGLERSWLPVARSPSQSCPAPGPLPVRTTVTFTG